MKASDRRLHAEAGVRRCFKQRNAGHSLFMPRAYAVWYCKDWIRVLRIVRAQHLDELAKA